MPLLISVAQQVWSLVALHRCSQGNVITACLQPKATALAGVYHATLLFSSISFPALTVSGSQHAHLCYSTLQFQPQVTAASALEVQVNATLQGQLFTLDVKEQSNTLLAVFMQVGQLDTSASGQTVYRNSSRGGEAESKGKTMISFVLHLTFAGVFQVKYPPNSSLLILNSCFSRE